MEKINYIPHSLILRMCPASDVDETPIVLILLQNGNMLNTASDFTTDANGISGQFEVHKFKNLTTTP